MVWGNAVTTLQAFVWIFNHVLSHNLIPVQLKSTMRKLNQITNLNMTVSLSISLNSPQSPTQLRNGQLPETNFVTSGCMELLLF